MVPNLLGRSQLPPSPGSSFREEAPRVLHHIGAFATLIFAPLSTQGAAQSPGWWTHIAHGAQVAWQAIKTFAAGTDALLAGALGAALGFLAKWVLEQWSVRAAARRDFAQKVTTRIATLAETHYWSLANYAGLLALLLEEYQHSRAHHLLLIWDTPSRLSTRLDELASEAADRSFPHFCRLVGLFDAFQFQGSNTYLLTSHASGESCKRLYNTLVVSLSTELNRKLANLYQLEIPYGAGKARTNRRISELPAAALNDATVRTYLSEEKKAWVDWLRRDPAGVARATDALRAYSELLSHELALLYKDWFNRSRPPIGAGRDSVADGWPGVLTRQSVATIRYSRSESPLLRPLGIAVSDPRPPTATDGASREVGPQPAPRDQRDRDAGERKRARSQDAPGGQGSEKYLADLVRQLIRASNQASKTTRPSGEVDVRRRRGAGRDQQ